MSDCETVAACDHISWTRSDGFAVTLIHSALKAALREIQNSIYHRFCVCIAGQP